MYITTFARCKKEMSTCSEKVLHCPQPDCTFDAQSLKFA